MFGLEGNSWNVTRFLLTLEHKASVWGISIWTTILFKQQVWHSLELGAALLRQLNSAWGSWICLVLQQPLTKERMPRSEQLTKLQDLDDRILRAASQKKAEAHCTLRSGEHIRKKLRLYAQSDSTSPGLPTSQAQSGRVPLSLTPVQSNCWTWNATASNICTSPAVR